ncbi:MAG: cupredoxin domain-containing protein [Actinomycetes bacterium]
MVMTTPSRRLTWKLTAAAAFVPAACLLVAGCSSSPSSSVYGSSTPNPTSSSAQPSHTAKATQAASSATLTISGFAFSDLTVKPGQTVTVVNDDTAEHTVNVHGTGIDVTVPGSSDASFKAPAKSGDYSMTCDFHPDMNGTLTVAK